MSIDILQLFKKLHKKISPYLLSKGYSHYNLFS
nr:MAG TPA: hypothetical protein [Caudoviricetes sp.]